MDRHRDSSFEMKYKFGVKLFSKATILNKFVEVAWQRKKICWGNGKLFGDERTWVLLTKTRGGKVRICGAPCECSNLGLLNIHSV